MGRTLFYSNVVDLKLIYLADGALDNWTFFDADMPHGFQLTDFYHASEYLKDAFDAAYPKDAAKARAKFEEYKLILRGELDGVKKALRALRHLRDQHKGNKIIADSETYFTNNQHRMLNERSGISPRSDTELILLFSPVDSDHNQLQSKLKSLRGSSCFR